MLRVIETAPQEVQMIGHYDPRAAFSDAQNVQYQSRTSLWFFAERAYRTIQIHCVQKLLGSTDNSEFIWPPCIPLGTRIESSGNRIEATIEFSYNQISTYHDDLRDKKRRKTSSFRVSIHCYFIHDTTIFLEAIISRRLAILAGTDGRFDDDLSSPRSSSLFAKVCTNLRETQDGRSFTGEKKSLTDVSRSMRRIQRRYHATGVT